MADALFLSRSDLERALDLPSVVSVLEGAFHAERRGEWDTPRRITARTASGGLLAMPAAGGSPPALGAKLVTTFVSNTALGLPSVAGLYALFDPRTGVPLAIMDGGYLTLVRTAAVSALAARLLSRREARSLGVLGAGGQAAFHIRLIAMVRAIEEVTVWARRPDRAQALVDSLRPQPDLDQVTTWKVAEDPSETANADVVVTATASTVPVLSGRRLSAGCLVIAMGAHTATTREIDTEAVTRASCLAVETRDTLLEAGDFQIAEAEAGGVLNRVRTLGEILDPATRQDPAPASIRIYKSCGVAFEDLAVAAFALDRARALGLGTGFPLG